ncbi:O-antigen ligase family protein [Hymenobacter terrestris]|uniref:O-antigen ligase family protein n=1 Tax=Hymenobacter terrestris TaxID=2748310 RepID=A0ABX2Q5H9_9BACT|nr:O-antigen ligase family protein [Hymenobacter terrestris]NVO86113.1 O-antigen ligase family protein [Hymenobacter terrestris]
MEQCLLFILYGLPLMGLLVTKLNWGGFKVFDILSLSCLMLFPKAFVQGLYSLSRVNAVLFLAFAISLLLGSLASEFPKDSTLALLQVMPAFVYCRFVVLACAENPAFYPRILRALRFSSVVLLFFIAFQTIGGLSFTFYPVLNLNTFDPQNNTIRYPGFFHDSQANGQFLAMTGFLFLRAGRGEVKTAKRLLYLGLFLACSGGILLSGSRSALGGMLAGLMVLFLCSSWRLQVYTIAFALVAGSLFALASPGIPILNRTANIDEDYKYRQSIWFEAIDISLNNPLLGIGIGNFQAYTTIHKQELYTEIDDEFVYFDQPENGYLKVLVETGFIGFILFLSLVLTPVVKVLYANIRGRQDFSIVFILAAITSWLLAFNTVYSLSESRITLIVVTLLALLIVHPPKSTLSDGQAA